MNRDNMNKKQSIQDKINEIKSRKKLTEEQKHMREMLDISRRCNNKSKMKITLRNDIDSLKSVCWIICEELMKYTLLDSDEMIVCCNESYDKILCAYDDIFIDYWERSGTPENECDLHNIFFSVDFYEDMEIENCEVYKRDIIYEELNVITAGLYVFEKLGLSEIFDVVYLRFDKDIVENEEEEEQCNDIKNNFMKMILDCMVKFERRRLKNAMDIECRCEECKSYEKQVEITITGVEHIDRLKINNIDISNLKMKFKSCDNENKEEVINELMEEIKKE